MFPILSIGPLALPVPALVLLAGFWIGLELTEKHASRFRADPGQIYNMTLTAILAGIIGARLAYAVLSPAGFLENPLTLLGLSPQMLNPAGGLVFALLAALGTIWLKKMPLLPTLDSLVTLFAVMAAALGISHFASGDAFGAPSGLPWAISLWGEQRHPSQIYETLAAVLITAVVWPGGKIASKSEQAGSSGLRFWSFIALSALARIVLESFRGDSILLLGIFRQAQVIAWAALALSLTQIGQRLEKMEIAAEKHGEAAHDTDR